MASAPSCEPEEGVKYPVKVEYCPNCGIPFEVSMIELIWEKLFTTYLHKFVHIYFIHCWQNLYDRSSVLT